MSRARRNDFQRDEHISLQGSLLSPFGTLQQQSLHEVRMANAVKVGPGSYRLQAPKISPSIAVAVNRMLKSAGKDCSSSKLNEAEYSLASDIAYFKMGASMEKRPSIKRVYFPDVHVVDDTSRKRIRIIKGSSRKCDSTGAPVNKAMEESSSSGSTSADSVEQPDLLIEPAVSVDGYEEVAGSGEDDDESGNPSQPLLMSEGCEIISCATYRELKGENNYLKEQLHASVLRVKQLEALIAERNAHVKNLVSENLQLLIKCRKLVGALGDEEAKEVLA